VSTSYADVTPVFFLAVALAILLTRRSRGRSWPLRLLLVTCAGLWIAVAGASMWLMSHAIAEAGESTTRSHPCAGKTPETFEVSLINVPLFLNRFGDVVPEGRMYVLNQNIAAVRNSYAHAADPFRADQKELIEPLTLRANRGDCIEVRFTNRLNEPAPPMTKEVRNAAIFTLPGETLKAPGTVTPEPRQFAPAATVPRNDFDPRTAPNASMHFDGLDYDVKDSDGTAVGYNPDSTARPGQTVTYRLYANVEGEFQFKDGADFSSGQTRPVGANGKVRFIGSHAFGAFGAFIIEEPGATWVDSSSGLPLSSGTRAIIKRPHGVHFREHVLFMHDEVQAEPGILTRFCRGKPAVGHGAAECVQPTKSQLELLSKGTLPGLGGGDADALVQGHTPIKLEWFAFNYRSEPGFNREEVGCPAATRAAQGFDAEHCIGEETSLSSWAYGDPGGGDLVMANYRGEPTQVRLLHPAEFETHTFHWHVNRWMFDPADEGGIDTISKNNHVTKTTNILDVQAVSPGSHYGLILQGGAGSAHGSKPATFGDIIFHCHLYPHFAAGMWGLNRTLDKLADGTRKNPDGTPVPRLEPLADHNYRPDVAGVNPPPSPEATTPGYPFFIPGKFGFKAPKPPLGVPERSASGVFPPTALEQAAADPGAKVPGAFFQNPCPTGRPTKTYEVAAIQIRQQYNAKLNWTNPQARVYVLQSDKQAVRQGRKPEPFAPILNVGDCVVYKLTNELPRRFGGTVFDREQETNEVGIHQHLVQFDVLSSDGTANGWNYDEGAQPGQTITYRDFVHENTTTNSFHDHFFPTAHQKNGLFGGSTIHPAGCVPVLPNTSTSKSTSTYKSKYKSKYESENENEHQALVGTVFDLHCKRTVDYNGARTDGADYRNFSLFVEDRVPLYQPANPKTPNDDKFVTKDGVPIFPAKFPSSPDDQGGMGINYRLEPFEARRNADPASLFDSAVHGDPFTPILKAYRGDPVKFRLFQLSQEESHGFNLDGFRWKFEPKDPNSNVIAAQHMGMLEYFDINIAGDAMPEVTKDMTTVDYLYNYAGADDWFMGAWGALRLFSCSNPSSGKPPIPELPDYPRHTCTGTHGKSGAGPTAQAPEKWHGYSSTRTRCTTGVDRTFSIVALNKDITYNKVGDHDPNGLMYALAADEQALRTGKKQPEPLVIRANAGDCLTIDFTNKLDPKRMKPQCHEALEPGQLGFKPTELRYPQCIDRPAKLEQNVPGFEPFPVSAKASISAQLVQSPPPEAVAPGQSTQYYWKLVKGVTGMALLRDRADVQNHLHHGLFGALIIEQPGSCYLHPVTGQPLNSGISAVITHPTQPDFRENIVLMNSDLATFRKDGTPVPTNLDLVIKPSRQSDDPEDQGDVSINYRNEPWSHRYAVNQNITNIFSSAVHGDPSTPVFKAYTGDKTVFRVGQAVGNQRSTSFALHGHTWRRAPADPHSQIAATQGQFNPGSVYNIVLDPSVTGGAGGYRAAPGDYLYRTHTLPRHLIGGQWGLFRVYSSLRPDLIPLPDDPMLRPGSRPAHTQKPIAWLGTAARGSVSRRRRPR
jgi:hypothetical protein